MLDVTLHLQGILHVDTFFTSDLLLVPNLRPLLFYEVRVPHCCSRDEQLGMCYDELPNLI